MQSVITHLDKENLDLRKTNKKMTLKNQKINKKAKNLKRDFECEVLMVEKLQVSLMNLREIYGINEKTRVSLSKMICDAKMEKETFGNQVFSLKQKLTLTENENLIIGDQLNMLYNSFNDIGSCEQIQTKCDHQIYLMELTSQEKTLQLDNLNQEIRKLNDENNEIKIIMREVNNQRKKLIEEKEKFIASTKEKMNQMDIDLKESNSLKEHLQEEVGKLDKQLQSVLNEKEKMKLKMQKLKNRRAVDFDQKVCKNCGKEYRQNENFNWSCRTHRSEWGGEMWWCCGRQKREAPGCKYAKHETKDDDEDEKEKQEEKG